MLKTHQVIIDVSSQTWMVCSGGQCHVTFPVG